MYISKAIKRHKKYFKIFNFLMIFIAILLPLIVMFTEVKKIFFLSYLGVIEILIVMALSYRVNMEKLEFNYSNNKLKYKFGILSKERFILCDKVQLVHTEKFRDDIEIILLTTMNFKNKSCKKVTESFLKRYPMVNEQYLKIKKINPENDFYFLIIRKGALLKYSLLDIIFKNCVGANYTVNAIDDIKIARGQREI